MLYRAIHDWKIGEIWEPADGSRWLCVAASKPAIFMLIKGGWFHPDPYKKSMPEVKMTGLHLRLSCYDNNATVEKDARPT